MNDLQKEKIYYNAINVAFNGDHRKIKSLRTYSSKKYPEINAEQKIKNITWEEAWLKIKNDFPAIDPKKEYEMILRSELELLTSEEDDFPALLKEIPWPPFAIYIKGKLGSERSASVVGTRKATPQGKSAAKEIAKSLARNGLRIISGLAFGIDEHAHKGALEANGITIAVLPTGLNNIYPKQNQPLAENIVSKGGALLSEFPINYKPYASSFIQRNRIISALSSATIVIEAPERSGALATARFALEQNREILVLPGPVSHPNYKGSHKLIREGARLVTCTEDILEDIGIEKQLEPEKITNDILGTDKQEFSEEEIIILSAIKELGWPASVDKISENTKIQVQKVNQLIAFLIIKGILK